MLVKPTTLTPESTAKRRTTPLGHDRAFTSRDTSLTRRVFYPESVCPSSRCAAHRASVMDSAVPGKTPMRESDPADMDLNACSQYPRHLA